MSPKPFSLDSALAELRMEEPSPEARLRARRALVPRPRTAWRLAAVSGVLALLLLPVALRTRGSNASAFTLAEALQASRAAPYMIQTIDKYDLQGRTIDHEEMIWAPNAHVERLFFGRNGEPGSESRHLSGLLFERRIPHEKAKWHLNGTWKPFESVSKTKEPPMGTEGDALTEFERVLLQNIAPLQPIRREGRYAWYRISKDQLWKIDTQTRRLVRTENRSKAELYVSVFDYPTWIDPARLNVPPLGKLPRFDLDQERADMDRLNRVGDQVETIAGKRVKLVGVFQEVCAPDQPIYVAYEGTGTARAKGLVNGVVTTMKSIPPKVVATVFKASGPLKSLDVEIPVAGGYALFRDVKVRPVSEGIRSALRTPPFE